jgi:hypothetical protein
MNWKRFALFTGLLAAGGFGGYLWHKEKSKRDLEDLWTAMTTPPGLEPPEATTPVVSVVEPPTELPASVSVPTPPPLPFTPY